MLSATRRVCDTLPDLYEIHCLLGLGPPHGKLSYLDIRPLPDTFEELFVRQSFRIAEEFLQPEGESPR